MKNSIISVNWKIKVKHLRSYCHKLYILHTLWYCIMVKYNLSDAVNPTPLTLHSSLKWILPRLVCKPILNPTTTPNSPPPLTHLVFADRKLSHSPTSVSTAPLTLGTHLSLRPSLSFSSLSLFLDQLSSLALDIFLSAQFFLVLCSVLFSLHDHLLWYVSTLFLLSVHVLSVCGLSIYTEPV